MKRKISKIQSQRQEYEYNQQYIQKVVKMNKLEYNTFCFETGIEFLNQEYPLGTLYEKYNYFFGKLKEFWNWWKSEWKIKEKILIKECRQFNININNQLWQEEMITLAYLSNTYISFQVFIKTLDYELQ